MHAPGIRDFATAVQAGHVLLHAHALAVGAFRELGARDARVGITLDLHPVYPWSDGQADAEAARRCDGHCNRWFLDPVFKGTYPRDMLDLYARHNAAPRVQEGDAEALAAHPVDFLGVNYYFPHRVYASDAGGLLGYEFGHLEDAPHTAMGWEVNPDSLFELLLRLKADYGDPAMYITENGAAYKDQRVEKGQVQDDDRIEYLDGHLRAARRAIERGVKLQGYLPLDAAGQLRVGLRVQPALRHHARGLRHPGAQVEEERGLVPARHRHERQRAGILTAQPTARSSGRAPGTDQPLPHGTAQCGNLATR